MKDPVKPDTVYDSLAGEYDSWIEESAGLKIVYGAFHETIRSNSGRLKGRVLDLGCGTGIFSGIISKNHEVDQVIGIDISRDSVRQAGERYNGKCRFVNGSATELPFPDSFFDAAVAFGDTISHIYEGYDSAIAELGRVIRPGGHLIFDVDNKWNIGLLSEPKELKSSLQQFSSGHIREWSFLDSLGNECSLHFKTFLPSEIIGLLDKAGLEIEYFRGLIILPNIIPQRYHYNYPPESILGKTVLSLSKLDRLVDRLPFFRGLGVGSLIIARKR